MFQKIKPILLNILLVVLPICSSLCIDMYLPAFGSIAKSFAVPESFIDISMSVYLIGLAMGQLLFGPLADKYGRKASLIPGLIIFSSASVMCALAPNIHVFIIARFLQAIGACSGIVLCRTIVADLYEGQKRTQLYALISASNIFSPAFAPLIGGMVLSFYSWRVIFIGIAMFGIMILICTSKLLNETLQTPDRDALQPRRQFYNLMRLFESRLYTGYVFTLGLLYGLIFVWVTLSPMLFIDYFHVSTKDFGLLFLMPALCSSFGGLIAARYGHQFNAVKFIKFGLNIITVSILAFLLLHNYVSNPYYLISFNIMMFFATGMIGPQLTADALANFKDIGGFASGFLGFVQTGCGGVVAVICSHFYSVNLQGMGVFLLMIQSLALITFLYPRLTRHSWQIAAR